MDPWDGGTYYETYMGRWSRQVATLFLEWLDVPGGVRWLDVGCGTGALTETIADVAAPASLAGIDPSADFIDVAQGNLKGRADLQVGDARSLPFASAGFDAAVSGIALNFVPDPTRALTEMRRVTRHGGTVGVYVWDYADGMQMIRAFWDAAVALDPTVEHLDEATRFPLCRPGPLEGLFSATGLDRIALVGLEIPTVFSSFDAYWQPFLGGQGPAPGYVASLSPARREYLRASLQNRLPRSDDGAITLSARAWAIRGVV